MPFLKKHLQFPDIAMRSNINGKEFVYFFVNNIFHSNNLYGKIFREEQGKSKEEHGRNERREIENGKWKKSDQ